MHAGTLRTTQGADAQELWVTCRCTRLMREKAVERRVSWLCATQADRERVLDMEQRLKPLRARSFAVLAVALLICGPWVGWWTLIPLLIAGMAFVLTDRGLQTSPRPEYRLALAWLSSELAIAASVALTGGPRSPAVAWLVLPVVTLAARFDVRGVVAGSSVAAGLILASSLAVNPAAVIAHPQERCVPPRAARSCRAALAGSHALRCAAPQRVGHRSPHQHAQPPRVEGSRRRAPRPGSSRSTSRSA